MAAPKPAPAEPVPAPETDPGEAMLRLAAVHTACMVFSDAAAHLRRTAMAVEAAGVAALTRSLAAGPGERGWQETLNGSELMMTAAVARFIETTRAAMSLATPPEKPPA